LKEISQRKLFDYLSSKNIQNFIGVPDSTLKYFIDQGFKKKRIIVTTREEEAIGIGVGMTLSGSSSLIFMQNAGFANSISTIASLVQLYEIPMIFLIGWRGYKKTDAPEHIHIGEIQPKLLSSLELKSKIIQERNWKNVCDWAIQRMKSKKSTALIIRRMKDE
jgi:sulfopyruvate decarboxylase TPP-binding subunit